MQTASAIKDGSTDIHIGRPFTIALVLLLLLVPFTRSYADAQSSVAQEVHLPEVILSTPVSDDTVHSSLRTGGEIRRPDWDGIWRDTGIVVGSQFAITGVLFLMPESVSSWSSEQKRNSSDKFASNFSHPVIDKDKFYINYILHPYWGSSYYTRARERGLDRTQSFVYSALLSTIYEFGIECIFEKPSIQDLIVTPGAGSLLGAFVFEPWRNSIKQKPELRWYDHVVLVATDPIGVLSEGFEKIFGIKPSITIEYMALRQAINPSQATTISKNNRFDAVLTFPIH